MKNIFNFLIILFLFFSNHLFANDVKNMKGFWFECEFSGKTSPPVDNCKMLDDDGFKFEHKRVIHVKNISSKEKNCKKQRIGQCFKIDTKSIIVKLM